MAKKTANNIEQAVINEAREIAGFKLEKLPIPSSFQNGGRTSKWPFGQMTHGESFTASLPTLEATRLRQSAYNWSGSTGKLHGVKLQIEQISKSDTAETLRVWCIAREKEAKE